MKRTILLLFIIGNAHGLIGQSEPSIILTDSTWGKEIIKFPIEWAPKVELTGYEELRFAPDWKNPKSDEFWSLIMSWSVKSDSLLPIETIGRTLTGYFDGLMKPNHWAEEFPEPQLKFHTKEENNATASMIFFDGSHTGKIITVNIIVTQLWCNENGKAIIVMRFSPKGLSHNIWQTLNSIEVNPSVCSF